MVQVHNDFFPDWPNMATKADMGVKNIRTPFEMLISFSSSLQYIHVKLCCRGSSSNSTNFTRSCCHKKSSIVDAICHIFIELSKNGTINWTFWIFPVSSALRGGLLWLISVNIIGVYYWSIESSNLISQWLHFSCIILWAASQSPFFTDSTTTHGCCSTHQAGNWWCIFIMRVNENLITFSWLKSNNSLSPMNELIRLVYYWEKTGGQPWSIEKESRWKKNQKLLQVCWGI